MKAATVVVFCVALVESCIFARADDTPNQAIARAALEQKLYQLNHPAAPPSPDTNSTAAVAKPVESATNTIGMVTTNAATLQTAPAATSPPDAAFAPEVPADNASVQAAALAALKEKMYELNHAEARPTPGTKSIAAVATNLAPANEASAAATPVIETPIAEAPVAKSPVIASSVVAPHSAAPAVVVPTPKVSTAPAAAASVAAVPAAIPGPVAMPAITPPATAPATPGLPASSPGQVRPANELVTTTGAIYKNVEVERVVPDGIVISYTPANGDWAMTKVYFRDLPAAIRQQYEKQ